MHQEFIRHGNQSFHAKVRQPYPQKAWVDGATLNSGRADYLTQW